MSLDNLSVGNELKDSYKTTSGWVKNGINWLGDIDLFYRERADLEKEYLTKLKELAKKYFEKKSKLSANLSVGDEPQITPGSLESASLVLWTDVLTQTEAIAEEKLKLSTEFQTKIGDNLVSLRNKCDRIEKQVLAINDFLVSDKKRVEDDVAKLKKAYDALCQATENARDKNQKSPSDKHQRKFEEKQVEMNNGKNEYLIKINVANRLKDKYYYQDVPEILDYLQELNEDRVALLNKLLKNACIIERNSLDRVKDKLHLVDKTIEQNNPKLDVAMFIKHNTVAWAEPQDFYFVPCSIWHDDESLVVKEPELTDLKKRLQIASNEYSKYEQSCLDVKQTLEESTERRKLDSGDNITLKFDNNLQNSLRILGQFIKEDSNRIKNEVEIEIIQNFAGDKDLRYVAPATLKKSRFGFLKGSKKTHHASTNTGDDYDNSDSQSINTIKTTHTSTSHHNGIFNLRRNKSTATTGPKANVGVATARALYEYTASSADETSISPGDEISVVEEDDGSGWTLVNGSHGQGLVPTTYIEIITRLSGKKPAPPAVAPKRGAKRIQYVEALYAYAADGDDELTLHVGDKIVLIEDDTDGSGWTEGELNGKRGMFPTSYVKKV